MMPDVPHSLLANLLVRSGLAGARAVMTFYASEYTVREKSDLSPVCAADETAEAEIVGHLERDLPDVPIVAEERFARGETPSVGSRFLLVDPLDGTKEFINRSHEFTVNISLVENGIPVAGIVLAPALGQAFLACEGRAWIGETGSDFSDINFNRTLKSRAVPGRPVAVASRSHSTPETEQIIARAGAEDRRSIGSSLKFCLVASGEADFYPRMGPTMEWDTAAGDAVLRAAGGLVTTLSGDNLTYGKLTEMDMRAFENPHFLAVGDPALLERIGIRPAS